MNQSLCVEQRVVVKGNSGVIKEKLFDKFRIKVICILISIQMIVRTVLVFILDFVLHFSDNKLYSRLKVHCQNMILNNNFLLKH